MEKLVRPSPFKRVFFVSLIIQAMLVLIGLSFHQPGSISITGIVYIPIVLVAGIILGIGHGIENLLDFPFVIPIALVGMLFYSACAGLLGKFGAREIGPKSQKDLPS